jgi:hypothetical protein
VEWTLSGASNRAKPINYENNIATTGVGLEGELFYGLAGQAGTAISSSVGLFTFGSVPAYDPVYWTPNGYVSYDVNHPSYSQGMAWSWDDPGYPGTWYVSIKSIIYSKAGVFSAVNQVPNPAQQRGYFG